MRGSALPRHRWVWSADERTATCTSCRLEARRRSSGAMLEVKRGSEWRPLVPGSGCTAPKVRTEGARVERSPDLVLDSVRVERKLEELTSAASGPASPRFSTTPR